jgi:hypothetical protein
MLGRMFKAVKAISTTFQKRASPFMTCLGISILHIIVSIGMVLDHLFFPSLRKTGIQNPIVIVGNPRTGTTFLQRFLVQNGFGAGMRIWKMLYPSLVCQTMLRPLLPLLEKMSPARFHGKAAHDTSLTGIETDDPALMFRYFDGFFLYGFFLAWAEEDPKAMFDPDNRDTSQRDFHWFEKIWKRNLISEKHHRIVAKIFSLSVRMPQFIRKFPDAKILYMVRDPLQAVPSGLSLITGVLDGRFGFWNLPEEKQRRYLDRLYDAFLDLNLKFYDDYTGGRIPRESVMVIPFPRIMQDFDNLMKEIMAFLDEVPSPDLLKSIHQISEKQKQFKSKHEYNIHKFGLNESQIKKDYAPIYKTFLS